MEIYTNFSILAEALLLTMTTEPKELMEDWISTLEKEKHTTLDSGWQPDPQHAEQLIFLNIQLSDVQVTGAICPAQTIQDQNGT